MDPIIVVRDGTDHVRLAISLDDLLTLSAGLNEALELIDEWEFPIRLGVSVEEARSLRQRLREALDRIV